MVNGDIVERRAVKVGGADGDRVEVLAALRAGERVVVSAACRISTDGAKVCGEMTPTRAGRRDVHKYFTRGSERIDVLKGVNLEIPQGDFLALMGPSGSGKTTLLNLIGGLDSPTGGSVDVGGVEINRLSGGELVQVALAAHRLRVSAV